MTAHQINSDDWTGGVEPTPPAKKSRFDAWSDRHPITSLAGMVAAMALVAPLETSNLSWVQYWAAAVAAGFWLAVSFGALGVLYLFLSKVSQSEHLALFQRRYLIGLGFVAFVLVSTGAPRFVAAGIHMLAGYL